MKIDNPIANYEKPRLDWFTLGKVHCHSTERTIRYLLSRKELDRQMVKFWELEECSEQEQSSTKELAYEEHF
ncbi:hypothetical protein V1477_008305 [Vespula maculifrons]|uniref:Uncharacterized protein n=1 Tax=Vespula maculifrons TaxID=7453 RepID=A0ABD2CCM5_VESMC